MDRRNTKCEKSLCSRCTHRCYRCNVPIHGDGSVKCSCCEDRYCNECSVLMDLIRNCSEPERLPRKQKKQQQQSKKAQQPHIRSVIKDVVPQLELPPEPVFTGDIFEKLLQHLELMRKDVISMAETIEFMRLWLNEIKREFTTPTPVAIPRLRATIHEMEASNLKEKIKAMRVRKQLSRLEKGYSLETPACIDHGTRKNELKQSERTSELATLRSSRQAITVTKLPHTSKLVSIGSEDSVSDKKMPRPAKPVSLISQAVPDADKKTVILPQKR